VIFRFVLAYFIIYDAYFIVGDFFRIIRVLYAYFIIYGLFSCL
jgi:hypothetical protein